MSKLLVPHLWDGKEMNPFTDQSIPPLFKYLPPERIDILEKERIAFTPPLRFNDPFDSHPTVLPIANRADLRRLSKVSGAEFFHLTGRRGTRHEWRELARRAEKYLDAHREIFAAGVQSNVYSRIAAEMGVLCLAAVRDSLLMWAHYAESHRGFVLEFDTGAQCFRNLGPLFKLTYSPERPVCDPMRRGGVGPWLVKSEEWAYEREFRIFRKTEHCVPLVRNGEVIYLCRLPKEAVRSVYVGVSMDQQARERVLSALRGSPIRVFSTKLSRTKFLLEFEEEHV